MKRFVLFSLVVLSGVLAACSQDSEATLESLRYGGARVVTDVEGLGESLSRSFDVHVAPTEKLESVAAEYGAGVLSYDLVLDKVWPPIEIDPEALEKALRRVSKLCQLILCDEDGNPMPDPRTGALTVGYDFTAVYATPELLERVADFGYSADFLSRVDIDKLSQIVAETGLGVASVGKYLPGSPLERFCQQRPVPRICFYVSVGNRFEVDKLDIHNLNEHTEDFGLIIVDYGDLGHIDLVGDLVQLHGEGLEPRVSPLQVGASKRVGEEAALSLIEHLYSDEGQYAVARAGVVPVTQRVYESVVADNVARHVEGAREHGKLEPSENIRYEGPTPHPF